MFHYSPYMLATLLSSMVVLAVGICLLMVHTPREPELRNYRIARRFLAGAFLFLGIVGQWEVWGNVETDNHMPAMAFTLIIASFQALLFTFSIITLIQIQYMTTRKLWGNIFPVLLLSGVLLTTLFSFPQHFYPVFYTMLAFYCLQLIYYIMLFIREYRRYRRRIDNYFAGDEYRRLLWIRNSFYMSACVGIVVVALLFADTQAYIVFMIAYTMFYVYFAIKLINYPAVFQHIPPIVLDAKDEPEEMEETEEPKETEEEKESDIHIGLRQWIEQKGYLQPDITLAGLARELNTNTKYLSNHINSAYGLNFRSWINSLRIGESMRLIDTCNNLLLDDIAERTGISSRSTFYRQFYNVTGMTPTEYRQRQMGKGPKA